MASTARVYNDHFTTTVETVETTGKAESRPLTVFELPMRESNTGANRRFSPRISQLFAARRKDGGPILQGIDLSFGGMMCTSSEPLWPGNVVDLELQLGHGTQPMPVRGRVVELVSYRGQVAMRVRFEGMSAQRRKRLAVWMAKRAG